MFVLQQLRDESHRFAITFHRAQRKRRTLRSSLGDIVGIGPSRQRALLRHFGSLRKIREAELHALATVPGMSRAAAQAVIAHFARQPLPTEMLLGNGGDEATDDVEAADTALEEVLAAEDSEGLTTTEVVEVPTSFDDSDSER
jgi:NAD-dependent DNA ligase